MKNKGKNLSRRKFITTSQATIAGLALSSVAVTTCFSQMLPQESDNLNIIGPKEGFTPQIGTLVSMLNWMRDVILGPIQGMSIRDLDYLHDKDSNSIGAMLWHLAAFERFNQLSTFEGVQWGRWPKEDRDNWSIAQNLGAEARRTIKGNPLDFYLEKLTTIRANSLKEFANRNDDWLMEVDRDWGWGPTNNYCKWFHVCEHESNHNGQIKYIKSRIS